MADHPDNKAVEIIQLFEREEARIANFRTLWQETADLIFPRENQIIRRDPVGVRKGQFISDPTAVMASMKMVSGLSQNLVPAGQPFFILVASNKRLNDIETVQRYLQDITDLTHEHLFASNFITQFNETLRNLSVFGTGCLLSEYTTFLNFRDYDIGRYVILENSKRRVDTILLKFSYTPKQAFEEWGKNVGRMVLDALDDPKKSSEKFQFIHVVRPRKERNGTLIDNLNMPFESIFIAVKEKIIVDEGGFEDFPYHVIRWTKSGNEVFGRGVGTFALPAVRELQTMRRDLLECANKHNNPPLIIKGGFDGEIRVSPGALNYSDLDDPITAIPGRALGNFPITQEVVNSQEELIRKMFFNDVFNPLTDLTGDRRTTEEIRQRKQEGLQQIGPPIGRINEEGFNTLVPRTVQLLHKNGKLPEPPPELEGQPLKVEYISRFALELKSHKARAFVEIARIGGELEAIKPGTLDNLDFDEGYRELARTAGVSTNVVVPLDRVEEIRAERARIEEARFALEAAQMAAQGIKDTSKAPEEGSPAKQVMEAVGA